MGNFKRGLKVLGRRLKKASPGIVAGISCIGVITTGVLAFRAARDVDDILCDMADAEERIQHDGNDGYITDEEAEERFHEVKMQGAKDIFFALLPTITSGALTITGIILSQKMQYRRTALYASMVNTAQAALSEYKSEVKALLKPSEVEKIEETVAKKKVDKAPPSEDVIFETGRGPHILMDSISGRYFRSNADFIRNKAREIGYTARDAGDASLNDFYSEVGLPEIPRSDDEGWSDQDFLQPGDILEVGIKWVNYENPVTGATEPCGVITFWPEPHMI